MASARRKRNRSLTLRMWMSSSTRRAPGASTAGAGVPASGRASGRAAIRPRTSAAAAVSLALQADGRLDARAEEPLADAREAVGHVRHEEARRARAAPPAEVVRLEQPG